MENLKEYKGITLVALVISIIVLLILAGVAINLAIGERGIFNQSKLAVEKYKDAQNKEEEQLQIAENAMLGNIDTRGEETNNKALIDFSKGEQETNEKWITGKKIYTKIIDIGTLPNSTAKSVAHNIQDVEDIWIDLSNSYWYKGGVYYSYIYTPWISNLEVSNEQINIGTVNNATTYNGYIAVKYTKTTDVTTN